MSYIFSDNKRVSADDKYSVSAEDKVILQRLSRFYTLMGPSDEELTLKELIKKFKSLVFAKITADTNLDEMMTSQSSSSEIDCWQHWIFKRKEQLAEEKTA
jgi:hypothetical protein